MRGKNHAHGKTPAFRRSHSDGWGSQGTQSFQTCFERLDGHRKERGISVNSSVMKFEYADSEINLLDTPGHQDFQKTLTAC